MNYVGNIFSTGMMESDSIYSVRILDEEGFIHRLQSVDKSVMSSKSIAEKYEVEYNPETFSLGSGDTLLIAQKVKENIEYYCVKVLEVL